jgi:hypothetical protein
MHNLVFQVFTNLKNVEFESAVNSLEKTTYAYKNIFLDKFVIKRTKTSATKSPQLKLDEKIIWTFQFVFPLRRNKHLRCKW